MSSNADGDSGSRIKVPQCVVETEAKASGSLNPSRNHVCVCVCVCVCNTKDWHDGRQSRGKHNREQIGATLLHNHSADYTQRDWPCPHKSTRWCLVFRVQLWGVFKFLMTWMHCPVFRLPSKPVLFFLFFSFSFLSANLLDVLENSRQIVKGR